MRILAPVLGALLLPLSLAAQIPSGSMSTASPVRVSGYTMARQLIRQVEPTLPSGARAHAAGTEVELYALVGKDGVVEEADALSGPSDLAKAAVEAAKQRLYRPYLVNGEAVAVQTTITITFREPNSPTVSTPPLTAISSSQMTQSAPKVPPSVSPRSVETAHTAPTEVLISVPEQSATHAGNFAQPAARLATPTAPSKREPLADPVRTAYAPPTRPDPVAPGAAASHALPGVDKPRDPRLSHLSPRILVQKVAPIYPAEAEAAEIEGTVGVQFTIKPDGTTRHIVATGGPPALRQAAIDAVSQWKYTPISDVGEEPASTAVLFTLEGPAKVPPEVMAGMIDEHEIPVYPPSALASGIHGAVKMHALIGRQGQVERLDFVSGPEELRESAMDAVRLWRYRPYLRNGVHVEVDTNVFVEFTVPTEARLQ